MTRTTVHLLPADEQALLKAYIEGSSEPADAAAIYDTLEISTGATPPRLAIAVAQILLHHIQGTLPQWASVSGHGTRCTNVFCALSPSAFRLVMAHPKGDADDRSKQRRR
jgi:hypothetical protein